MVQVAFDTLKFVETLESSGLPKEQARAISLAVQESHETLDLVTRRDLNDFRQEIDIRFTKVDSAIAEVRKDLSAEIAEVRKDLSAEIADVRKDLSTEIAEVRKDLSAEIADVRKELLAANADVRKDLSAEIADLRKDLTTHIQDTRQRFEQMDKRFDRLESRFDRLQWFIVAAALGLIFREQILRLLAM